MSGADFVDVLTFFKIITIIVALVGTSFAIPIAVAAACAETSMIPLFAIPMACSWAVALAFWLSSRKRPVSLSPRGAFVIVASAWISASLIGALPLYFSGAVSNFTDAFFESVSGITTTGSSVINDIDSLPRSVNLWRCETHWLGGMGIVALTVALLPLLGVGGFQLIKAETTGPEKGKVTPKITTTAKALWLMYLAFTAMEAVALKIAGMDFIDALSHAFATLGTGGFSTRGASIGTYDSAAIDAICSAFMFLAGVNFSLYYYALARKWREIRANSELKAYVGIFIVASVLLSVCNMPLYGGLLESLRRSVFQVASILSTTGFATADYQTWSQAAQFIMFILFFIGGCSGSTAGGVKVIRWVVLSKQVKNEMEKMMHPRGIFNIRLDGKPGRKDIVFSVASFMALYAALVFVTTAAGCAARLDLFSALTAALSMVGNVGPAFGVLGPSQNYAAIAPALKLWYCFAMLAGRLELYTMIIFFMPAYWKK